MTQEDKDILLKDLCARLPYGVKCRVREDEFTYIGTLCRIEGNLLDFSESMSGLDCQVYLSEVKPYLFPLSSMTEEQKEELFFNYIHNDIYFDDFTDYFLAGELWHDICVSIDILPELINWLNKHHLDWRGLIPMGLAIDATDLNIY